MRVLKAMLLAGALVGLAAGGAMAAGSGGGGGASMPSVSGPSYDPAAEYAKAIAALQAKDYKAASRAAQRVTEAAPKSADAWRLLGVAQSGAENWKGAKKAYERAIKLAPDDLVSHAGLGKALAKLQDPKAQAELAWLKAKAEACGTSCPDAANLKSLTAELEGVMTGAAAPAAQPAAALDPATLFAAPRPATAPILPPSA